MLFNIGQIKFDKSRNEQEIPPNSEKNEDALENNVIVTDDDDGENVISLNKIKSSVTVEDDQKSQSDIASVKSYDTKAVPLSNVKLQSSFQPGSTPSHLLSYFMVQ